MAPAGFLDLMVPMYIEARYPEQKDAASRMLNRDACEHLTSGMRHPKYFLRSNNGLMDCCSSVKNSVLVSFC